MKHVDGAGNAAVQSPGPLQPPRHLVSQVISGLELTLPLTLLAWGFVLTLLWISGLCGVRFSDLSRDPLAVAEALHSSQWYYGALSNLGALLWCSATSIAAFMASVTAPRERSFWGMAGGLTGLLMLDDLFQLHDRVLPMLTGTADDWLILAHGVVALAFVLIHYRRIRHSPYEIALCAVTWLAVSVVQDVFSVVPPGSLFLDADYLVEDGSKFVGISLWTGFVLATARSEIEDWQAGLQGP